jgi:hypothetical protein
VHETAVVPGANTLPDGGVHVTTTSRSTRSVAVIGPKLTVARVGSVALVPTAGSGAKTGRVVSATITAKLERATCRPFRAVILTVVLPSAKTEPLGFEYVTVFAPLTFTGA